MRSVKSFLSSNSNPTRAYRRRKVSSGQNREDYSRPVRRMWTHTDSAATPSDGKADIQTATKS